MARKCYDGFFLKTGENNGDWVYFENLCIFPCKQTLERLRRYCERIHLVKGIELVLYDRVEYREVMIVNRFIDPCGREARYLMDVFNVDKEYREGVEKENYWYSSLKDPIEVEEYFLINYKNINKSEELLELVNRYKFIRGVYQAGDLDRINACYAS